MQSDLPQSGWVKVWDPFVRLFHWLLVMLFAVAYLSAEWHRNELHLLAGYGLSLLLLARVSWGFIGGRYARFGNFWYGPRHTLRYTKSLLAGHPLHYRGHNPLGGAMVFVLLSLLLLMVISGLLLAAGLEFEGPLLALNPWLSDSRVYWLLDVHRYLVYILLGCVCLHLIGVVMSSRLHQENLVLSMITGKKPVHPKPVIPVTRSLKQGTQP